MLIEKTTDGRPVYWTGDEWISRNVTGWRDAARFADYDAAEDELASHADDDEFLGAVLVDCE